MKASNDAVLWNACVIILGQASPANVLRLAVNEFDKEIRMRSDHIIKKMTLILRQSLLLSSVPLMFDLTSMMRSRPESRNILRLFAELLQGRSEAQPAASFTHKQYRQLLINRCRELMERFGSSDVPILHGELFSVHSVAERLLENLTKRAASEIMEQRAIFEASTGIDCHQFYENRHLQPIAATAIVKRFIESADAKKYKPGCRYFFGHEIPN
jgi:hypothetical protein